MTLASILTHIQEAADELGDLLKEEARREEGGTPTSYVFFYEQTGDPEEPGVWWPNYHFVEGYDIEEAFRSFGHLLKVYGLTVGSICYGPEEEMGWAMERVSDYWEAEREKKKRGRTP